MMMMMMMMMMKFTRENHFIEIKNNNEVPVLDGLVTEPQTL